MAGRAVQRRHDYHLVVLVLDFQPDSHVLSAHERLLVLHRVGREERAVTRVSQRVHHPRDGAIGERLGFQGRPVHELLIDQVPCLSNEVEIGRRRHRRRGVRNLENPPIRGHSSQKHYSRRGQDEGAIHELN